MPTHKQHTQHAEHNEKLLALFKGQGLLPEFTDWYVTVIFYTVVQHFEAMLCTVRPIIRETMGQRHPVVHTNSHDERLQIMNISFVDIQVAYMPLYILSRAARYQKYDIPAYAATLSEKSLAQIKALCREYIRSAERSKN